MEVYLKNRRQEIMRRQIKLIGSFIILLISVNIFGQTNYQKEVQSWREKREAELKSENGWFSLAGLFWLKEGINTIGAGKDFDIQLTDNFKQGKFGEIVFQNETVTLKIENGVEAFNDNKQISEIVLVSDEKGKPNVIQTGSQNFYLIKREDKYGIRLKDKNTKERLSFNGLNWFPVNKKLKINATFEPFDNPKEIIIPNQIGGSYKMKSSGILKFKLNGKTYSLQPIDEGDKYFIVFRDLTSKNETYGLGRFLYAERTKDGKVVLDFNKAENPPCAYTSFATCPIPPPQNRLQVVIKAGEKRYGDH